ncbi:DNA topoisomerase I [archaeon]|nr:MAG: DNA topoisomerase I [archaeon]
MAARWKKFVHSGVYFPPTYQARGLSVKINGKKFKLNPEQEEMIWAWAKKIPTPYSNDEVFASNFLADFKKVLPKEFANIKIGDIDFSDIVKIQEAEKNLSKEDKKALAIERKKNREKLKEKYGYVDIDGNKAEVANYMVEPPGIFIGRGNHPLRGKWKYRIQEGDVILNLSKDALIPAGQWKKVINGDEFMWVASWEDRLTGKVKYVWPSESSSLRQAQDQLKYDKAMMVEKNIEKIRKCIDDSMKSKDVATRKVATVCYIIDKLVMRVGDEKDEDEADTVGASTLRVEHIKFKPDGVEFDFLGKDSVRWQKTIPISDAEPMFVKNMKEFTNDKKHEELVFDGITSRTVNLFLGGCVKGVTAKVFRTYHATKTLQAYLNELKIKQNDSAWMKLYYAKMGNVEVALTCNHKKTPPKTWEETFARKQEKLNKLMATTPKTEKQAAKLKEMIEKMKLDIELARKTKELNLGTSLKNYIDPRVYRAWLDKVGLDWTKMYTAALQKKFSWTEKK